VSVRRQAYNSPALIGSLAHHPKIPCHAGALKKGVNVQLLTAYFPKTCSFLEKTKLKRAKYSQLKADELPTFIIADNEHLLLLIRKDNGKKKVADCGKTMTPS